MAWQSPSRVQEYTHDKTLLEHVGPLYESYDNFFIAEVGTCRVQWGGTWVECSQARLFRQLMPALPGAYMITFGDFGVESQSSNQGCTYYYGKGSYLSSYITCCDFVSTCA